MSFVTLDKSVGRDGPAVGGEIGLEPFLRSSEQVRAAGRWILGVVGGLGAILLAGLRFADLGTLDPYSGDSLLAVCGAGSALAGLSVVLVGAGRLLEGRYISLREVLTHAEEAQSERRRSNNRRWIRRRTGTSPIGVPIGWIDDSIRAIEGEKDLLYRSTGAQTIRQVLRLERETIDGLLNAKTDADRSRLRGELVELQAAAARVAAFADERFTRRQFKELGRRVAIAAPLVAAGIVAFSIAVAKPEPKHLVAESRPATVYLTRAGTLWTEQHLSCPGVTEMKGVILGGVLESPILAVAPAGRCRAGQFVLRPEFGVAVPDTLQGSP